MIKQGTYRHYKGKMYRVIEVARHSETLEELVVYWDENDKLWVRPKKVFAEKVIVGGKEVPRFKYIG